MLATVGLLFLIPFFVWPSGWFGDDAASVLAFAQRNLASSWADIFLYRDHEMDRYRPFMQALVTFSLRNLGLDTLLIRSASYAALLVTLVSLLAVLRRFRITPGAGMVAVVWFAVVPIKTQAFARPGRPEIFVTAFCLLAVLCLERAWRPMQAARGPALRWPWGVLCLVFGLGSALWAEIGISVFLVLGIWTLARLYWLGPLDPGVPPNKPALSTVATRLLLPAVGLALYAGWYVAIGAPVTATSNVDGRYSFQVGSASLRNVVAGLVGLISPIGTPGVARLSHGSASVADWLGLVLGTGALLVLAVAGARTLRRDKGVLATAALFFSCGLASLFPFVLVGHVSEVYLTQSAAFMSGCAGIIIAATIEGLSKKASRLLAGATMVLLTVMSASSWDGFTLLRHNANVSSVLYSEMVRLRQEGEERVVLIPPCEQPQRFSQYYLPYDGILLYRDTRMPQMTWLPNCAGPTTPGESVGSTYRVDLTGHTVPYSAKQ